MTRFEWQQFAARCQKPDYRTVGNWYARRVSRPLALRLTRIILPCGISAHAVTIMAWTCGLAAIGAFAWGSEGAWLAGAALLQISYMLDHVDGQIARYRGTASLDGIALDYLMHHSLSVALPWGLAYAQLAQGRSHAWLLCGAAWSFGALLLSVEHDVRCKAIVARLKRLHGELLVRGGAGGRPTSTAPWPVSSVHQLARLARLSTQWHVAINVLTALAVAVSIAPQQAWLAQLYLLWMAVASIALAGVSIARSLRSQAAEREFAAWYEPPADHALRCADGWWFVEPIEDDFAPVSREHSPAR